MIISTQMKVAFVLTLITATLSMPETAYWLLHSVVVGLFELLEGALDEIIEHLFDTDRHTTQIIVFYLMWVMFLFGSYRLFLHLKNLYASARSEFPDWFQQKRIQVTSNWQELSLAKKLKMISGCSLGAACIAMLVF
ncbi:MAG: hypothetical protein ACU85E_10785 [Gammaproteobacteria bacterium]